MSGDTSFDARPHILRHIVDHGPLRMESVMKLSPTDRLEYLKILKVYLTDIGNQVEEIEESLTPKEVPQNK